MRRHHPIGGADPEHAVNDSCATPQVSFTELNEIIGLPELTEIEQRYGD